MSLYRYKGRVMSMVQGSANIIGGRKMTLLAGSTFVCGFDPIKDNEHQITEYGQVRFERARMHAIDLATNITGANKMQILPLNSTDSYNWNGSEFFDVESVINGDGLTKVNEVVLTRPIRS